jgi:GntR family transcriptional repressor for pyruvate dehydrogenase complex
MKTDVLILVTCITSDVIGDKSIFTSIGNKEPLSKKVAAEIEEAIVTRKLETGDKLPSEKELCAQFGVSRTSLREALSTLSAKGLVSIEKGRGIFIKGISSENITGQMHNYLQLKSKNNYMGEVMYARLIIEPSIAAYAALNRKLEHIEQMNKDIELMESFQGSVEEYALLDMTFHLHIAQASCNDLMPLILKPIHRFMPEIKSKILAAVPDSKGSGLIGHPMILDAIIARDPDLAFERMKEHIETALKHTETMLKYKSLKKGASFERAKA